MSFYEDQVVAHFAYELLIDAVTFNLCTGLAYGMFFVVCCISIKILLSKGPLSESRGSMFLFGTTTIIFMLSTTFMVFGPRLTSELDLGAILTQLSSATTFDRIWSPNKSRVVSIIIIVITRSVPIFSDVVCAWRAMVLWKYDRRVVTILSICLLGTIAVCIYQVSSTFLFEVLSTEGLGSPEIPITVIVVGPILVTNVLSTALIAWKAWDYHVSVGAHFRKGRSFGRVEKVLLLLIESGFVYCILWMLYLLNALGVLVIPTSSIFPIVMLYVSGTYPLIINVLAVTTQSGEPSGLWVQSVQ